VGISLNHQAEGAVGWFSPVDANWSTLESQFVARQNSDASVVTVSGTTAETALMANTTIPANGLAVGTVLDDFSAGTVSIAAFTSPSVVWRLRWGGISGTILVAWTWNFTGGGGGFLGGWIADHKMVGVSTGASGSLELQGWMSTGTTFSTGFLNSAVTVDTTASKVLLWTVQPSLTSVTITQRMKVTNKG
jgi:hypothetical protein